jgi:hypothetical protein
MYCNDCSALADLMKHVLADEGQGPALKSPQENRFAIDLSISSN